MKIDWPNEPFFRPGFVAGVRGISAIAAVYGLVFGPLAVKVFWWLRDGYWTPLAIGNFVPVPVVERVGAQAIIDWVWGRSVAVSLALAGLAVFFVVMMRSGE